MKNEKNTFQYDIDELVSAYPDQDFLQASQQRAWNGLQQLRQKEKKVVIMRKVISIAAAILTILISSLFLLINKPPVADSFQATMVPGQLKLKNTDTSVPQPALVAGKILTKIPSAKKASTGPATLVQSVAQNTPVFDSVPITLKEQSARLVSFREQDSLKTLTPSIPKQKMFPPSTNELFDGMQKLANSKMKKQSPADIQKTATKITVPNNTDTLFPKPFN